MAFEITPSIFIFLSSRFRSNLQSLIPKTLLQHGRIRSDQWVDRLRTKLDELSPMFRLTNSNRTLAARLHFLEIVKRWPLFGAQFFPISRVIYKREGVGHEIDNCILALNGNGFRIICTTAESNEVHAHYHLDEVEAVRHYTLSECYFVEIALSAKAAQRLHYGVVTVETEMVREGGVLGKHSRAFIKIHVVGFRVRRWPLYTTNSPT